MYDFIDLTVFSKFLYGFFGVVLVAFAAIKATSLGLNLLKDDK